MAELLPFCFWIPFIGFLITTLVPSKKESLLSGISIAIVGIHFAGVLLFVSLWLYDGMPTLDIKHLLLYSVDNVQIIIDFYFDKVTAVFACVGSFLTFLVVVFSRYYIHRDPGFKRFFNTIVLFFSGYNMLIFSGNYETLFVGWEILGICTFLLVSFYRDRYLPVKNSMKVISTYRLGDICLILAMWMSHHVWDKNILFSELTDWNLIATHFHEHYRSGVFISLMIFIAAAIKSAQFPFSSWLPRAMEGPTTSSAIFYGSLSVHAGVFILLRTYPYWEGVMGIKAIIIVVGAITCVTAIYIARLQSALKAQIAYSSVAQIALMFIEVALGFHVLALIHFTGNAFLRTYQLLVSPSVQSYLVHEMVFNFVPGKTTIGSSFTSKISNTFYILSLKEWNMDAFLKRVFWDPFKWFGNHLSFLSSKVSVVFLSLAFVAGLYAYYFMETVPTNVFEILPYIYSFVGMLLVLKSFTERSSALSAWRFVFSGQLFITIAVALHNDDFDHSEISLYLSGAFIAAIVGYVCLKKMKSIDNDIELNRFHGYVYEQPRTGFIFLLSCLGVAGLPFTPTFIGMDLLFNHIHRYDIFLLAFASVGIVFIELSVLRIYSRIFMGQHKKAYHPIAFRSA